MSTTSRRVDPSPSLKVLEAQAKEAWKAWNVPAGMKRVIPLNCEKDQFRSLLPFDDRQNSDDGEWDSPYPMMLRFMWEVAAQPKQERPRGTSDVEGSELSEHEERALNLNQAFSAPLGFVIILDFSDREITQGSSSNLKERVDQWALYLHSRLMPRQLADELRVWVIAPPGREDDIDWVLFNLELIRDSMVCPKNLWLPPADPQKLERSAQSFLSGTFLARPWHNEGGEADGNIEDLRLETMANQVNLTKAELEAFIALLTKEGAKQHGESYMRELEEWLDAANSSERS